MRIIDADSLKNNIKKYRRYAADKDTWLIDRFIETVDDEESVPENFDKTSSDDYNKYKWHDLRKNPNDLPNDNDFKKDYIIILDNNTVSVSRFYGRGESCQGQYEYPNGIWQVFEYYAGDVIAWKEVGPLDEVVT